MSFPLTGFHNTSVSSRNYLNLHLDTPIVKGFWKSYVSYCIESILDVSKKVFRLLPRSLPSVLPLQEASLGFFFETWVQNTDILNINIQYNININLYIIFINIIYISIKINDLYILIYKYKSLIFLFCNITPC